MGVHVAALVANRRSPDDAGELLRARRAAEEQHLQVIRSRMPGAPLLEVPLVAGELTGQAALMRLAGLLETASMHGR